MHLLLWRHHVWLNQATRRLSKHWWRNSVVTSFLIGRKRATPSWCHSSMWLSRFVRTSCLCDVASSELFQVVCALAAQKPIVTIQYLEDCVQAAKANTDIPNPFLDLQVSIHRSPEHRVMHEWRGCCRYLPVLSESQLDPAAVTFGKKIERKNVFSKKLFIYLCSKQV